MLPSLRVEAWMSVREPIKSASRRGGDVQPLRKIRRQEVRGRLFELRREDGGRGRRCRVRFEELVPIVSMLVRPVRPARVLVLAELSKVKVLAEQLIERVRLVVVLVGRGASCPGRKRGEGWCARLVRPCRGDLLVQLRAVQE